MSTKNANLTPERRARKREQERARMAKRAAEVRELLKQMPPVECECGCGELIPALTKDGRPRRYADRHGSRAPKFQEREYAFDFPVFGVRPACAGEDPELFWGFEEKEMAAAKAVCIGCPVREQCLAWALEHREYDGVWGGLTPRERRRLARRSVTSDAEVLARSALEDASVRKLTRSQVGAAVDWLTRRGQTAEEIADRLHLDPRTVYRWRARLREAQAA